ncbi:LysR family transcriptional regulator [Devosia sp. ZB163]|uniref:LysR family transcriptional regulator n=1 Tax=Devosia sp. ZB163 TaxID=3025938 RepID=UPI0023603F4C|nr:LysR family transcriptional regulator [Devosia sp. ZB163]MDC9826410.1 LysR family transcriptional regulator [Devosia sp. ZB163]
MHLPLDLDQLRTFCAIADCGSFTEASRRVNKTQPAVSVQMKRLEQRLGVTLFVRDGHGATLTSAGELMQARARRMLKLNAEIVDLFVSHPPTARIRFGVPNDYAAKLLPAVLPGFNRAFPAIAVEVECFSTPLLVSALEHGELDLIVITQGVEEHYGELFRIEPLRWVMGETGRVLEEEILPLACASPSGSSWRQDAVGQLNRIGRAFRIVVASSDAAAIVGAIRGDLAVGYLPDSGLVPGLVIVPESEGLPPLIDARLALMRASHAQDGIYDLLARHIVDKFGNLPAAVTP